MEQTMDVSDKRVAINLLMTSCGKCYWEKTVKERLARMKAMVLWLQSHLSHF